MRDIIQTVGKVFASHKVRVFLVLGLVIAIVAGGVMFWRHHLKQVQNQSVVDVSSAPQLQSIPGAGNPSNQYVKAQNEQNRQEAIKARQQAKSAVPTITRPNFIGSPSWFTQSKKATTATKTTGPKKCPINQIVVKYKPNPENCTLEKLRLARQTGVTAEELVCQGCACPMVRAAGYTAGDLKNIGYSAEQLRKCGFNLQQLVSAGYNAKDLKAAGYTAKTLQSAGFTPGELKAAGFDKINCDVKALKKARAAGASASILKSAGCGVAALKAAGYTAAQLKSAGFTARELKNAGFNADQLKAAGFTASQLAAAGFSAATKANCDVASLQKARLAGDSATALRQRGCGLAALKAAGFTAAELKSAGFTAKQLKNAGFNTRQLKAAGFSAAAMKQAGFDAKQLKEAGFSAAQLKNAGFNAAQLRASGFTAGQLKNAGFNAKQLKDAGYSAADLKNAGFSAKQLKDAGFSAGQLKSAGFSAKQLKGAGFSAKQLRDAGYSASQLKNAGYSAKQLAAAGYSKGDLLRAGFTPKEAGYQPAAKPKTQTASQVTTPVTTTPSETTPTASAEVPSITANTPESRLAKFEKEQQKQLSKQQRQDKIRQTVAAMTSEGQKLLQGWSTVSAQSVEMGIKQDKKSEAKSKTAGTAADGTTGKDTAKAKKVAGSVVKAGTVMFGVLITSIDSDEKTPIMAKIVSGKYKGSKLLGSFKRVNKKLLLTFNLINEPGVEKSQSINTVAIDPETARTAMSGLVNNHYLLRYGTLFASAFLEGIADSIVSARSSVQATTFGLVSLQEPLNTEEEVLAGLGKVGKRYSEVMADNFSRPPTVRIPGGTGFGLLFMSDVTLPKPVHKDGSEIIKR